MSSIYLYVLRSIGQPNVNGNRPAFYGATAPQLTNIITPRPRETKGYRIWNKIKYNKQRSETVGFINENLNYEKAKDLQALIDLLVIDRPVLRDCHVGIGRTYKFCRGPCILVPVVKPSMKVYDEKGKLSHLRYNQSWSKLWTCRDEHLEYITVNGLPTPYIPAPICIVLMSYGGLKKEEALKWERECTIEVDR